MPKSLRNQKTGRTLVALWLALVTNVVTTRSVVADESAWKVTEGKGYTACERLARNLDEWQEYADNFCELKLSPKFPEFSFPEWQPLDIEQNLRLVYSAELQLPMLTPTGTPKLPFDQWLAKFRERVQTSGAVPRLRSLRTRLNKQGPETLIMYEPDVAECARNMSAFGYTSGVGGHIFVHRPTQADQPMELIGGTGSRQKQQLILYQGVPFFLWAAPDSVLGPKHVWRVNFSRTSKFRFIFLIIIVESKLWK